MENRKHPRIGIDNLVADISDGKGFYVGVINNISRMGLSISDLSPQLDGDAEILTAVVNGQGENFKMFLKPRWEVVDGVKKSVGMEIESSSWGWTEFVIKHEPDEQYLWSTMVH